MLWQAAVLLFSLPAAWGQGDARLPRSVLPSEYFLELEVPDPNSGSLSYTGAVTITVTVHSAVSEIALHSHLLDWGPADTELKLVGTAERIPVTRVDFEPNKTQFARIGLGRPLAPEETAELKIRFRGLFESGGSGSGFFLSNNSYDPATAVWARHATRDKRRYQHFPSACLEPWAAAVVLTADVQAQQEMMYATQFEEMGARRAFPCFDEPGFKAHYSFAVTYPAGAGLTALTNTREVCQPVPALGQLAMETARFKRTLQPMSSYLVAFSVGRFDYVEAEARGVRLRVYTPPGKAKYAEFALGFTAKVLAFFSESWGLEYAEMNDKMDQISVPSVVDNAMENWGLLTYFPAFLLVDDVADPSLGSRQMVASVTAHEISHQWFGDTITNEWWNAEYLQEGFARLWQYVSVDAIYPEWDIFNAISTGSPFGDIGFYGWPYNRGMDADVLGRLPAPVVGETETPSGTAFYEKGAAVNRMFATALGQSLWFKVLARHLARHKWTNPGLADLLASFNRTLPEEDAGFDAKMRSWLLQPGMPLVTVAIDAAAGELVLNQRPSAPSIDPSQRWWIPLDIRYTPAEVVPPAAASVVQFVELGPSDTDVRAKVPAGVVPESCFVEANYNFSAFVLVNYTDRRQWERIIDRMAEPGFPAITRQQLQKQLTYLAELEQDLSFLGQGPSLGYLVAVFEEYRHKLVRQSTDAERVQLIKLAGSSWASVRSHARKAGMTDAGSVQLGRLSAAFAALLADCQAAAADAGIELAAAARYWSAVVEASDSAVDGIIGDITAEPWDRSWVTFRSAGNTIEAFSTVNAPHYAVLFA